MLNLTRGFASQPHDWFAISERGLQIFDLQRSRAIPVPKSHHGFLPANLLIFYAKPTYMIMSAPGELPLERTFLFLKAGQHSGSRLGTTGCYTEPIQYRRELFLDSLPNSLHPRVRRTGCRLIGKGAERGSGGGRRVGFRFGLYSPGQASRPTSAGAEFESRWLTKLI